MAIRPGISCSASSISLRPYSARERSATLKWGRCCSLVMELLRCGRRRVEAGVALCRILSPGLRASGSGPPVKEVLRPRSRPVNRTPSTAVRRRRTRPERPPGPPGSGCLERGGEREIGGGLAYRQGVVTGDRYPGPVEEREKRRGRNGQGDRPALPGLQGHRIEGHQLCRRLVRSRRDRSGMPARRRSRPGCRCWSPPRSTRPGFRGGGRQERRARTGCSRARTRTGTAAGCRWRGRTGSRPRGSRCSTRSG